MTAGAVQIELFPTVIDVLSHGIVRSLVIRVSELLGDGRGAHGCGEADNPRAKNQ
jgi:hypothetical protein